MRGSICGYYAGTRPERLTSLTLIEGLGPPDFAATEGPTRTAAWIDSWRAARANEKVKVMPSLDEAVRRLRRNDDLLSEPLARRLAEAGTRPHEGGFVWKHDPLHVTFGPYAYRLETARRYWQNITCPVLCVDGARSRLNLPEPERAARRANFKDVRNVVFEDAGHAVQRHQPAQLAAAILEHYKR